MAASSGGAVSQKVSMARFLWDCVRSRSLVERSRVRTKWEVTSSTILKSSWASSGGTSARKVVKAHDGDVLQQTRPLAKESGT